MGLPMLDPEMEVLELNMTVQSVNMLGNRGAPMLDPELAVVDLNPTGPSVNMLGNRGAPMLDPELEVVDLTVLEIRVVGLVATPGRSNLNPFRKDPADQTKART